MAKYEQKSVALSKLTWDLRNPRLYRKVANADEALNEIIRLQGEKLKVIAMNIAEHGLDPSQLMTVIREEKPGTDTPLRKRGGKYTVIEGNRRLAALKLLDNPGLLMKLAPEHARAIKKQVSKMTEGILEIPCIVYENRRDAEDRLRLRHAGVAQGAGLDPWGPRETRIHDRNRGKPDPTLDVYEFVREYGGLSEGQLAKLPDFPFTNLERFIRDPEARGMLGISSVNGTVYTQLGRDQVVVGLRRLVLEVLEQPKTVNSRTMRTTPNRLEHLATYGPDLPASDAIKGSWLTLAAAPPFRSEGDPPDEAPALPVGSVEDPALDSNETLESDAGEEVDESNGAHEENSVSQIGTPNDVGAEAATPPSVASQTPTPSAPSAKARKQVFAHEIYVDSPPRLNLIHSELRKINIHSHPNAAAVLLRVFVELSIDTYCQKNGIPLDVSIPQRPGSPPKMKDKNLETKFQDCCSHMENVGGKAVRNTLKPVRILMCKAADKDPSLIDQMHGYIHNAHSLPLPAYLRTAGDILMPFLLIIWPYPGQPAISTSP